jgi:hypothetical protein
MLSEPLKKSCAQIVCASKCLAFDCNKSEAFFYCCSASPRCHPEEPKDLRRSFANTQDDRGRRLPGFRLSSLQAGMTEKNIGGVEKYPLTMAQIFGNIFLFQIN